jgi:IstB-like ATP binding protein
VAAPAQRTFCPNASVRLDELPRPTASRFSRGAAPAPGARQVENVIEAVCVPADHRGDEVTAAAMIDRLVHHAEILALKGDSYRLKDRDLARTLACE